MINECSHWVNPPVKNCQPEDVAVVDCFTTGLLNPAVSEHFGQGSVGGEERDVEVEHQDVRDTEQHGDLQELLQSQHCQLERRLTLWSQTLSRADSTRSRQNLPECLRQDSTAQPCLTDRELLLLVSRRNPRLRSSNSSRVLVTQYTDISLCRGGGGGGAPTCQYLTCLELDRRRWMLEVGKVVVEVWQTGFVLMR